MEYERHAKPRWQVYQDIFPGGKSFYRAFLLREKLRDPEYAASFLQNKAQSTSTSIFPAASDMLFSQRHIPQVCESVTFPVIGGNYTIYMTSGTSFPTKYIRRGRE